MCQTNIFLLFDLIFFFFLCDCSEQWRGRENKKENEMKTEKITYCMISFFMSIHEYVHRNGTANEKRTNTCPINHAVRYFSLQLFFSYVYNMYIRIYALLLFLQISQSFHFQSVFFFFAFFIFCTFVLTKHNV